MSGEQRLRAIWKSPRFWLIIVIAFAIPLLADFNTRLAYIREMTAAAADLSKKIDAEAARHEALLALQDYIHSNEFVEHWARQARLARAGETVIVPGGVDTTPALTNTMIIPTPQPNDPRNEWAALFLGPR
jgi:hypothetical protein